MLLAGSLVFFGLTQIQAILFSLVRISITSRVGAGILLVSALVAVLYGRWLHFVPRERSPRDQYLRPGEWVVPAVFLFAAAWYLLLWFLAYLMPDSSWDGLWYHNPTIHFWALRGRVHWITADYSAYWTPIVDSFWNGYPKAVELFGFILVRATALPRLLNAVNLPWLPLGVLSIVCLARTAGANIRWSVVAGVLFLLIPVNISQAPTTYVDAAAASSFVACLAMTVVAAGRISPGSFPWKLVPALGCSQGLALGVKGTGAAVFLLSAAVIASGLLGSLRGQSDLSAGYPGSAPGGRGRKAGPGNTLAFFLAPVAIALAVGGYWYIRNYLHTGSPLHPVGFAVAGHRIFPGELDPGSLVTPAYTPGTEEWNQFRRILFAWGQGWSVDQWKETVGNYTSRQGGLGFLWLLGCLPAVGWILGGAVFRLARRSSPRGDPDRAIIRLSFMVLALFLIVPRNHIARFTIWIYGLGLPALAAAVSRLKDIRVSVLRTAATIWIMASVVIALLEGVVAISLQRGLHLPDWPDRGPGLGRLIQELRKPYPADYVWPRIRGSALEELISGRDPVALGEFSETAGKNRILGHLTQGPALGRRPVYFLDRETVGSSAERLGKFIESRGIRYLIWDTDIPIPRPLARQVDEWHRVDGLFYLLEFYYDADGFSDSEPGAEVPDPRRSFH